MAKGTSKQARSEEPRATMEYQLASSVTASSRCRTSLLARLLVLLPSEELADPLDPRLAAVGPAQAPWSPWLAPASPAGPGQA